MFLADCVSIARRFQRSIRIDTDLHEPKALDGYVATKSSIDVLLAMARHVKEQSQGAFTWTGPYGSGKSSLVVVLGSLLSGTAAMRKAAVEAVGRENAEEIWKSFPVNSGGWQIIPIVGRKERPIQILSEVLEDRLPQTASKKGGWSDKQVIEGFMKLADKKQVKSNGVIIFVDEMGKCLEAAGQEGSDIYIFQQLAESASRSGGRLIVVGILHQAFQEYALQLSREMRDEWTKIQGRFVDLPVNAAGEEQIEMLGRAIVTERKQTVAGQLAEQIAECVAQQKPSVSKYFGVTLENCWPLHPVVACLLGPISRRRFGQNQRSLFAFLNSAEPRGFQDFLKHAREKDLYTPEQLWDYLRLNLEPSILASPDGHRWALAVEAIERCESQSPDDLHLALLKTVALVELFRGSSGLMATQQLLQESFPGYKKSEVRDALKQLQSWSLIIFKKFQNAYAIFAG
ncbi:MAG TPA: ATP-binding protein, partial [Candidatus Ozemobacteraceae bacterium]|nr:ATP-binding protein [Candidatus Ozemobacteraceae bacterium]